MKILKYPRIKSLKRSLIVSFFLLVIIPTAIIGIFSYISAYNAFETKISNYSRQIAIQTASNVQRMLQDIENISLQIVSMKELDLLPTTYYKSQIEESSKYKAIIKNTIDNVIISRTEIVGINIFYKEIDTPFIYGEPLIDLAEYEQSNIYLKAMESQNTYEWISTYKNPNTMVTYTYITTLARKIIDDQTGEIIGLLLIGIKEFSIADVYSYLDLGPSGFTFIVDEQGGIVSDLDKKRLSTKSNYPFVKKVFGKLDEDQVFMGKYQDKKVLVSYAPIGRSEWQIINVVPYNYLISEIQKNGMLTLRVAAFFVFFAIAIALVISISIFSPIERLNQNMKAVETGNFAIQNDIQGTHEIAALEKNFNRMVEKIDLLVKEVYESKLMKQEAEIKALHAQINPHFLYNTLTVIDGMALKSGQQNISDVTQILADIFRYSTSGNAFATIEEEILQVKKYLTIQSLRRQEQFHYDIFMDEEIKKHVIPKLLLQPIIENAIKHGLEKKANNMTLIVTVNQSDAHTITILIKDNGIGIDPLGVTVLNEQLLVSDKNIYSEEADSRHIGIKNVNNRIKNYYGETYGLRITSVKEIGTEVILRIGVKKDI